jgi:hypothetical protein
MRKRVLAASLQLAGLAASALALAVTPAHQSWAQGVGGLLSPQAQASLDAARKYHWQKITVLNHAATTIYVTYGQIGSDSPRPCAACAPYGSQKTLEAAQTFTDTYATDKTQAVLTIQANTTSSGATNTCLGNSTPDRKLNNYMVTVTGTLFGIKCSVAQN